MAQSSDCVFCRIATGAIPCLELFNSPECLCFLDIGPLAEGHALLIPKAHYARLADVPGEVLAAVTRHLPLLAKAIAAASGSPGCNVLINDGQVAGQVVPHLHIHVVPRREGDALGYRWHAGAYPEGRAELLCGRIRQALS